MARLEHLFINHLRGIERFDQGGQGTGTFPNLKNQRFAYLFPHSVLSWEGL